MYTSSTNQLFCYFDVNNREELARMVAVEHLPFNFGEKVLLIIVKKVINPSVCCVSRPTLTFTLFNLYKKRFS